jgi:hypothetical protein
MLVQGVGILELQLRSTTVLAGPAAAQPSYGVLLL